MIDDVIRLFYVLYTLTHIRQQFLRMTTGLAFYLHEGCNHHLSVSNSTKTSELICMKFSGKVGNRLLNRWLNFGGDPDHRMDTGIVFWIRHYWKIRKVVNGHSVTLMRQMAALVRIALVGGMYCLWCSSASSFLICYTFVLCVFCTLLYAFLLLFVQKCCTTAPLVTHKARWTGCWSWGTITTGR